MVVFSRVSSAAQFVLAGNKGESHRAELHGQPTVEISPQPLLLII
jgi:hypothetical protein